MESTCISECPVHPSVLNTMIHRGFPSGTNGKEPSANAGDIRDLSSIPGSGRSPGGGHDTPFQYLAWRILRTEEPGWATVHSVAKSRVQLK